MKSIEISQATRPLAEYAKRVAREAVVVLRNGKPLAVLSSAEGMDAESIALANNPKFAEIIKRSRERHQAEGGVSIEEVRRRLGIPRRKRTKRAASR